MHRGFWFKKDTKDSGLARVSQGERGYTVYYGGANENDAQYCGAIYEVKKNPFQPASKDNDPARLGRMSIRFRNAADQNFTVTKTWETMDEALAFAKTWFPDNIARFVPAQDGATK